MSLVERRKLLKLCSVLCDSFSHVGVTVTLHNRKILMACHCIELIEVGRRNGSIS